MKHWGVMIASGKYDEDAMMIELDKRNALKEFTHSLSFASKIWSKIRTRKERELEEWRNPQLKIRDTGLTTTCTDPQIRAAGKSKHQDDSEERRLQTAQQACDDMGGTYHLLEYNCQTMADYLIGHIQYEKDQTFDRTQLEGVSDLVSDAVDKLNPRDRLPRWLGGY